MLNNVKKCNCKHSHINSILQVCGFKVPSPLLKLPSSDIVNGIAIDAMHCVFLGVVKQLVGLWFNSKHSGPKESPPYQSLHPMSHFVPF